jgi:hypothetical protein
MTPTKSVAKKGKGQTLANEAEEPDLPGEGIVDLLRELITALDRRVPRLERTSEDDIARDAAALREKALKRIAKLEKSGS